MAKVTQEEVLERRMDILFRDSLHRLGIRQKDWIKEIAFKQVYS